MLFVGVSAPAGTLGAIVDKIAAASRAAMSNPAFLKTLTTSGLEAIPDSNPALARRFLQDEHERWEPVIKAISLKVE